MTITYFEKALDAAIPDFQQDVETHLALRVWAVPARNIGYALGLAAACWLGWRMPVGLTAPCKQLEHAGLWHE